MIAGREFPGLEDRGTGHAANCELNYTPQRKDGSIDISEALKVNTEFDLSRQLWSYLIRKGAIPDPRAFIHPVPHMSFVWGRTMSPSCASASRRCPRAIATTEWNTRRIEPRSQNGLADHGWARHEEPFAATRIITGTDVDYGALTHLLVNHLSAQPGVSVRYNHHVVALDRENNGGWRVGVEDVDTQERHT